MQSISNVPYNINSLQLKGWNKCEYFCEEICLLNQSLGRYISMKLVIILTVAQPKLYYCVINQLRVKESNSHRKLCLWAYQLRAHVTVTLFINLIDKKAINFFRIFVEVE